MQLHHFTEIPSGWLGKGQYLQIAKDFSFLFFFQPRVWTTCRNEIMLKKLCNHISILTLSLQEQAVGMAAWNVWTETSHLAVTACRLSCLFWETSHKEWHCDNCWPCIYFVFINPAHHFLPPLLVYELRPKASLFKYKSFFSLLAVWVEKCHLADF